MLVEAKGLIHNYLCLTIDNCKKHHVIFIMCDYLEIMLEEAPNDIGNKARAPEKDGLFVIDRSSYLLNKKRADFFHRMTARLSFSGKRSRPDIQVAIAYLCTRVKAPEKLDFIKMARDINYIRYIVNIQLVLGWDRSSTTLLECRRFFCCA